MEVRHEIGAPRTPETPIESFVKQSAGMEGKEIKTQFREFSNRHDTLR